MINEFFTAFLHAYKNLGLKPSDFELPNVWVEEKHPKSQDGTALLSNRLDELHKSEKFAGEIAIFTPIEQQKHHARIQYLKKRIILTELRSELAGVEKIVFELKAQQALTPKVEQVLQGKIEGIKKEIERKLTNPLP